MKDNHFMMDSDGICLYLTIGINAKLPAKLIIVTLNLILIGIIVFAVTQGIIAMMILSTLIWIFLLKYSFWNFYGKEHLVINTKTMMYQHDYGFFRTNPKLKFFQKGVSVVTQRVGSQDDNPQIRLAFHTYNAHDLPEEVYQTTLPIGQKDANTVISAINSLFIEKVTEDYSLPPIFMN